MGAEESHTPLPSVPHDFGFLAVVFKIPDNIRVIHGSEAEHSVIYHSILDTWKEGIQARKQKCAGSVLCFKLKGLPFETGLLSENIREVVCRILRCLQDIGWQHIASTNLTQGREWFTLVFVRSNSHQPPIREELAYIAMSSTDKLQFWNLHEDTRDKISSALRSEYPPGLYHEEAKDGGKIYEALLLGSPWDSTTSRHGEARGILVKVISIMMERYSFLCAMNVKRTEDTFVFFPKSIHSNTSAELFIVSLRKTSKLQVFKAPEYLIPIIHNVLVDACHGKGSHSIEKKIIHQSEKVEFKYKFHSKGDGSAQCAMTKFIVCKLLEVLKSQGWSIVTGFDMSRGLSNKGELLFQKSNPHPNCKVFCLSPVLYGKICVINAPPIIIESSRELISRHLPLKSETYSDFPTACVSFELGGKPWSDSGDGPHFTHSLFCHMLDTFLHTGFKVNLTADVISESTSYGEDSSFCHDPNAWWFMHEPEIVMSDASPVPEWKSEEASQSQISYEKPSEPLTPTAPQSYGAPPPSYEIAMRENEQKHN